ncbi:MAG: cytochrome c, partial [Chloroflexi bacterium]|nr:cytochrome c [Chloroflexota bacterium]
MPILRWLVIGLIAALLVVVAGLSFVVAVFFLGARTALDTPSDALLFITESGKTSYLIPGDAGNLANPKTPLKPDALAEAKRTYTARCLTCHGSDGKGQTPIGQHTFPRAADLTAARTQSRSDGALFWLVANGIPHTGMPGWKTVLNDDELWSLVAY